jgi:hypothetical protein
MQSAINALMLRQNKVSEYLVLLLLICLFGFKTPLSGVHWDVPIYLYQSKLVVESSIVESYSRFSHQVADQVRNHRWPEDESYPESYWHFTRLGNSVLLGSIVYLVGDSYLAIVAASWTYSLLLALSLLFASSLVRSVNLLLDPAASASDLRVLTIMSMVLYGMSDIYAYLSGNLVSEVPAMFFLAAGMASLVKAFERGSYSWAIGSGILGFLVYVVRMEGVWAYATGGVALFIFLRARRPKIFRFGILLVAGVSAGALYCVYAWRFYPMADPTLFLQFATVQHGFHRGGSPLMFMVAGGGLLWIGFVLSICRFATSAVVRFAALWLALQFIPFALGAINGIPAQTRMYALTMPSLMLLSTAGLKVLSQRGSHFVVKAGIGIFTLLLLVVSNSFLYASFRTLPGVWRMDVIRAYLSPPRYEKMVYPVGDLAEISRFIYGNVEPVVFVRQDSVPQDYTNLIRYFGPPVAARSDIALGGDPTNGGECGQKVLKNAAEQVVFCTHLSAINLAPLRGRRLLSLESKEHQPVTAFPKRRIFDKSGITVYDLGIAG